MEVAQMNGASTPARAPQVRRMTGRIGAEIVGAHMAGADTSTVEQIRDAILGHRVVAVRDQFLKAEDLVEFGAKLGGHTMLPEGVAPNHSLPNVLVLQSGTAANKRAETWHTDATTSERPPSFSILAAQVLPEAGGDTMFVDMGYAYRTLTPQYQRLLQGLRVRHVNSQLSTGVFENWHPIVRTIPETGDRVLFPGFPKVSDEIEGMTVEESRSILQFLHQHATRPDAMYRHRWAPGDVLIWDNRATMHYAVQDYGDETRTMIRLMLRGERPYEAPYSNGEPKEL